MYRGVVFKPVLRAREEMAVPGVILGGSVYWNVGSNYRLRSPSYGRNPGWSADAVAKPAGLQRL